MSKTYYLPLKGGLEQDGLTGWRKCMRWRGGDRKWIKRRYNRRIRKTIPDYNNRNSSLFTE